MKFTKMQGLGNDYVYVNCFEETVDDPAELARKISDRHFGVGSDGLILICPSDRADVRMDMYNADGSRSEMCGNGIRCVGRYAHDRGLAPRDCITVETLAGIKELHFRMKDGKVEAIRVDMGVPELKPELIPVLAEGERFLDQPVQVDGKTYRVSCVSMGNPHAAVYCQDVEALNLEQLGPHFEHHPLFPKRINTEFVQVVSPTRLKMRVWERGSGETLACGTGACGSFVVTVLNGLCEEKVTMELLGGCLELEWDRGSGHVFMTGPAEFVFDGEYQI